MTFECSDYISQICNSKKQLLYSNKLRMIEIIMQLKNKKKNNKNYRYLLYITDI